MTEIRDWADADVPEPQQEIDMAELEAILPRTNGHVTSSSDGDWVSVKDVYPIRSREPELGEPEPRYGLADFPNTIPGELLPIVRTRYVDGATFVRDVPPVIPSIWKDDASGIAWAKGEGLMLVGPDGVGKTSLAQQLVLARIGVRATLLGMDVEPAPGRILYIAADRPRQAASSLRRMVNARDEELLEQRLVVWKGPLEFDLTKSPQLLREFVDSIGGVSDVVVDSLKDLTPDLVKDDIGSRVNMAFQVLIACGYELLVLHHQRKEQQGGTKPRRLADVYGSRWLTAGMGSVLLLWGEPGDLLVELRHLKQPEGDIGPFNIVHDHARGASDVHQRADLVEAFAQASNGVTVADAALLLFEATSPSRNETEKARRRLNTLVDNGRAVRRDDPDGLARYFDPKKAP